MTTIQHNFYIQELYVKHYEGAPNAVARVRWMCVLSRGAGRVFAGGQTDLQQPDPQSFINIAELEAQQVIDWVLETLGGQPWLDGFIAAHEEAMQQAEADAAFEPWHIPLVNPLRFDPANV